MISTVVLHVSLSHFQLPHLCLFLGAAMAVQRPPFETQNVPGEMWPQMSSMGGDFQSPPPPPYPGTGRAPAMGHMRPHYAVDGTPHQPGSEFVEAKCAAIGNHESSSILIVQLVFTAAIPHPHHPNMHPSHAPTAMMAEMKPEDMHYRDFLRGKELELASRLDKMETDQSAMKKKKKQLQNRQKQVCFFVYSSE